MGFMNGNEDVIDLLRSRICGCGDLDRDLSLGSAGPDPAEKGLDGLRNHS